MHTLMQLIPLSYYRTLTYPQNVPSCNLPCQFSYKLRKASFVLCSDFFPPQNHFICFSILYNLHHVISTVLCKTFIQYAVSEINPCRIPLMAKSHSSVWICQRLFIHYHSDTHLISFQCLNIMDKRAMNISL